jgi:hypothetical protein
MEGRKRVLKPLTSTEIPVDDPIAAIELFMESGWTDGSNSRFAPNIPIRAMSEGSLGTI